jgi:hypothetical protein
MTNALKYKEQWGEEGVSPANYLINTTEFYSAAEKLK